MLKIYSVCSFLFLAMLLSGLNRANAENDSCRVVLELGSCHVCNSGELSIRTSALKAASKKIPDFKQYSIIRYRNSNAPERGLGIWTKLTKAIGQRFEVLLVDPGIVDNIDDFISFSISGSYDLSTINPWDLRQDFAKQQGKVNVLRALALTDAEYQNILKFGIFNETTLNPKVLENDFETFVSGPLSSHLAVRIFNDKSSKDYLLSVTTYPEIAIGTAKWAQEDRLNRKKEATKIYLFTLRMDRIDLFDFANPNSDLPMPEDSEWNALTKDDFGHPNLTNYGLPKDTPVDWRIESLIPVVINKNEIVKVEVLN